MICYIQLYLFTDKQQGVHNAMQTINPDGQLNNYATEPALYFAEFPSPNQQFRYLQQGAIAFLLVSSLLLIAIGVS